MKRFKRADLLVGLALVTGYALLAAGVASQFGTSVWWFASGLFAMVVGLVAIGWRTAILLLRHGLVYWLEQGTRREQGDSDE